MKRLVQNGEQATRQPRRSGLIKERGKDTYLVRIYLGLDAQGKRRYLNKTIKGKRKDAQAYLNKTLTEISTGTFVEPTRLTVNEYLDRWLEGIARPRVSQRTADGYAGLLDRYIREPIGRKRLDQL